jgi:hypothetical protein
VSYLRAVRNNLVKPYLPSEFVAFLSVVQ